MIRRFIVALSLIILLSIPLQHVSASSDKAFTTIRLNKFGSVAIVLGNKFGFDIAGLIKPFFTKEGEIAMPNFAPTADWLDGAEGFMTPQNYTEDGKHMSWISEIFYTTLYGAILKTSAPHGTEEVSPECIISTGLETSTGLPDARRDFENARRVDAWYGINPVNPDESGVVNFDLPQVALAGMNAAEDCKRHDPGLENPPIENALKRLSQFGGAGTLIEGHELETIMKIVEFFNRLTGEMETREEPEIEQHDDRVILTADKKEPYHSIQCHHGGCPGNESGEYSGKASETGGWTAFLLREEDKKPFTPASVQPYDIQIAGGFDKKTGEFSYDLKNLSDRRTEQAACYVVPDTENTTGGDLQLIAAVGGDKDRNINKMCKPIVANCPIDIIKTKFSGAQEASCKLCNQKSVLTHTNPEQAAAFGSGLSQLGIKVIESAADTYKVPAGVLLATMLHEGAFNPHDGASWSWSSDATIEQYSDCTNPQPMPNCTSPNDAIGPFGFIVDPWWNKYMENDKNPYDGKYHKSELEGMQDVVKEIPKENFSPCNFTDAAYMAARELSEDSSHVFETVPGSCTSTEYGTINFYQGTDIPQSCSSWSPERVATSRLQYAEGIDEGACSNTPEGIMVTNDIGRMVQMYGEMKCGGDGMNHF